MNEYKTKILFVITLTSGANKRNSNTIVLQIVMRNILHTYFPLKTAICNFVVFKKKKRFLKTVYAHKFSVQNCLAALT